MKKAAATPTANITTTNTTTTNTSNPSPLMQQRPLESNTFINHGRDSQIFDRYPVSPTAGAALASSLHGGGGGTRGSFSILGQQQQRPVRARAFRRNSIATMDTRLVPLKSTDSSAADRSYNDLAEITKLTKQKMFRRNSMTKVESEVKLRYSLATMMDYKDQNDNLQRLRERFQQSRTSVLSSTNGRASQRSSVIGSVVGAGTKVSDEEFSIDYTTGSTLGLESMAGSIPVSLVQQTIRRKRLHDLERENLIESLVNFSCHTPRVVLEDLITREIKLWEASNREDIEQMLEDEKTKEIEKSLDFEDASLSSLSSEEAAKGGGSGGGGGDNNKGEGSNTEGGGGNKSLDDLPKSSYHSKDPLERKLLLAKTPNSLPDSRARQSALLFVDINGFTKLSTMLDVESLSKVINSYFEMIVTEVILYGGDILKFAGDAIFAEWRPNEDEDEDKVDDNSDDDNNDKGVNGPSGADEALGLKRLNASLSSSGDLSWGTLSVPNNIENNQSNATISTCVLQAAKCAAAIVRKFSDYHVGATSRGESLVNSGGNSVSGGPGGRNDAMLNVHCGIGAGNLVGLHVGDYREGIDDEGQEEEAVELRREYLFLGNAINQVSKAAHIASDGQVMASPESIEVLANVCEIPGHMESSKEPVCIASRSQTFLPLDGSNHSDQEVELSDVPDDDLHIPIYENLRRHCGHMHRAALSRLHLQVALYVHPVVRGDELAISHRSKVVPKLDQPRSRHLAEAELRSVYTVFIKALVSPKTTGRKKVDKLLFKALGDIMHVTSRELDRYSGHLRQFIVDDKGVVLIATFGLRGSTFPNLVSNNALPATLDIQKALKDELGVETRIGATFGTAYCGVVGGVRRHEFAVMGAAVNLAARLMESKMNKGILVDEAVKAQADDRFAFRTLPPVTAKGYDNPVAISEPLHAISSIRKKGPSAPFTGRQEEKSEILGIAKEILDTPTAVHSSVINVIGEAGMGKTALGIAVTNEVKLECLKRHKKIVASLSTSNESEQRIPLCAFRKVFLSAIRELCLHDGSISFSDDKVESSTRVNEMNADPQKTRDPRSKSFSQSQRRLLSEFPKRMSSPEKNSPLLRAVTLGRLSSRTSFGTAKIGSFDQKQSSQERAGSYRSVSISTIPRPGPGVRSKSLHSGEQLERTDSFATRVPYLDKLCWVCEELNYPHEYADLVGSQFLGIDAATPITQVNGHVPLVAELVEFMAQAYMRITDFADLILVFIDDFQWVDSFTWKVIRALGQSGKKMLLICAMKSHDKQAMRRMSTAVNFRVEITLGPLYLPDIRELIASVLGYSESTIDDFLCTEIYQKTGGLPVYLIELLEDIKRNKTMFLSDDGVLRFTAEGQKETTGAENCVLIMKEALLNRFDALDVRVRKVLQTCAVLGNSFALSDLIRVHPEVEETEIEMSLDVATNEMILVEVMEDEEDNRSLYSNSTGGEHSNIGSSIEYSKTSSGGLNVVGNRYFRFSHDMWRSNVLTTMLKQRKIELHRLIAEALEKDQSTILERSDIARLLTLFDHWKSCGDFRKAAPLALAVGTRLNEWDLSAQSLDLYQDALEMCFESVDPVDNSIRQDDWVKVAGQPEVLDLIVRLHIRIAESYRLMGDLARCVETFQDAYSILNSSTGTNRSLMVPILSGLCTVKLEVHVYDVGTLKDQEMLIQKFVKAAQNEGNAVHLSRALSMEAAFFAQQGDFERALQDQQVLQMVYKMEQHSARIIEQYHKDYAAECFSNSIQWYYLMGQHDKASRQADLVIQRHLPFQNPHDVDNVMMLILPAVLVLKFMGRASEADYIMKRHIINAHHDFAPLATYWVETFNPICYLLEIVMMEEEDKYDFHILQQIQTWVLDESSSYYSSDHVRLGHTLMGEICWRLGNLKSSEDHEREELYRRARCFLTPIARDTLTEPFLAHSALAFLKAM